MDRHSLKEAVCTNCKTVYWENSSRAHWACLCSSCQRRENIGCGLLLLLALVGTVLYGAWRLVFG